MIEPLAAVLVEVELSDVRLLHCDREYSQTTFDIAPQYARINRSMLSSGSMKFGLPTVGQSPSKYAVEAGMVGPGALDSHGLAHHRASAAQDL